MRHFVHPGQTLLDHRFPLPLDRPFTHAQARAEGLGPAQLGWLCEHAYLRRPIAGVYVAAQATDSLHLRAEALRLVVPPDAVITDRTAGWLHGAEMVLAPGDHDVLPKVSMFVPRRGARLRNDLADSGQRFLRSAEVIDVLGLRVTSPVRTACDLGRLLHRDRAFAALDSMLALGCFDRDDLWETTRHLRGMRGVRQLRAFIPLADGRAQSPGESITRLRWLDVGGLPDPELQIEVPGPHGWPNFLDLGVKQLRFAVEYDGEEWHRRTESQRAHDAERRAFVAREDGWSIRPVTKANVFGHRRDIESLLVSGIRRARRRLAA